MKVLPPTRQLENRRIFLAALLGAVVIWIAPVAVQASQSVILTWNPSTNDDVVGYNVYYGNASGLYTGVLNVGNVTNTQVFCVADGVPYYFAVSALDSAGDESPLSAEVSYTVPLPPPATLQTQTYNDVNGQPWLLGLSATSNDPAWWELDCSTDLQTWSPYTYGYGSYVFVLASLTDATQPQMFFRLIYY